MKYLLLALLACALSACADEITEPTGPVPPPGAENVAPDTWLPVTLSTARGSPDWVSVARQRDCPPGPRTGDPCPYGEVFFNQRTITRTADGSMANIWVQTRHGAPQLYAAESEDGNPMTIRYELTRLHYRINCVDETFAIIERQILGEGEVVVASERPPEIYRPPARWSSVPLVMRPACRGS